MVTMAGNSVGYVNEPWGEVVRNRLRAARMRAKSDLSSGNASECSARAR